MTVYIDLIIIVNYIIDFSILFYLNKALKRNEKIFRLLLGALFGSVTVLIIFIPISDFELFILKLLSGSLMVVIAFGFKDIKYFINNLAYLYIFGIILGGCMYLLDINSLSSSISKYSVLIILSPVILKIYAKYNLKYKKFNQRYSLEIKFKNDKKISLMAFVDSGNKLKDPYFNRPIILIEKRFYKEKLEKGVILVPYTALNHDGMLKCIVPKSITIEGKSPKKDVLIGLSDKSFNIDGVNCILNEEIMEEIYV